MQVVWDALAHTPWWVYVLFFYLVSRGIKAREPALTSPLKMAIVPAIMTIWGGASLVTMFPVNVATLGAWLLAMAAGAGCGYRLVRDARIRADHASHLLWRPGDHSFLPLVVAIFAVKYAFGYRLGADPGIAADPAFYFTDIVVSGVISGVFIGRFATLLRKYHAAPSEPLAPAPVPGARPGGPASD